MKRNKKNRSRLADTMIISGFFVFTVYWILDSILSLFFANQYNFIADIFGSDLYNIYIRVIVLCLFIIFGSHAQSSMNKLKRTDERYRALFEHNPIETIIVDHDGKVTGYNPSKKKSGSRLPKIGDVMYREYAGKHDIDMYQELMDCIKSKKSKIFPELKYLDKYLQIRMEPFSQGAIITAINITEQKMIELALKESEERYRTLADNIPDMICSLDKNGRVVTANKTLHSYGYEHPDIIGKPLKDFVFVDDKAMLTDSFSDAIRSKKEFIRGLKFRLVSKDGHIRWIELNSKFRYDPNGDFIQSEGVLRDITERIQLEERLQNAQKMEAIATLAGGIAHQFNNILGGITGNTELMMNAHEKKQDIQTYCDRILYSSHRMTRLTNQMLAYARRGKYQAQIISLIDLIEDTMPLIKHSIKPDIHLKVDLSTNHTVVKADPIQMQMVLTSVIYNASEAIEGNGHIQIKTDHVKVGNNNHLLGIEPGNYVLITIADDGKGMDEEARKKIFEPFYSTKLQGRGLGMAASYGIIRNHNGWIKVDSELGRGSTVGIYLPLVEGAPVSQDKRPELSVKGAGTILIVDDEEDILLTSRSALIQFGYDVVIAQNGTDALEIIKKMGAKIDLTILDIGLPDIQGDDVYRQIVELQPEMKFLVSTGYAVEEVARKMNVKEGAFIQKPFSFPILSVKLKELLGDRDNA